MTDNQQHPSPPNPQKGPEPYPNPPQAGQFQSQPGGAAPQGAPQNQPAGNGQPGYGQPVPGPPPGYGPNAYGQQPGYGPAPYGQPPFAQGYPGMSAPMAPPYAHWGKRVLASIVDGLCIFPFYIIFAIGMAIMTAGMHSTTDPYTGMTETTGEVNPTGSAIVMLGVLAALAFTLWNQVWKQGRTGQSIGKKVMNIALLRESTGAPLGPGLTFARSLAHCLDSLLCCLGYLWPLWDDKRQTFADKAIGSVVVDTPQR